MRKISTLILLFLTILSAVQAEERNILAESRISRVIVFLHGAQIEREQQLFVPAGTSTILFQGLSPEIDEQSIQVKGAGNFTILAVNRQSNFLNEQKVAQEIKKLQEKIASLQEEQDILQNNNNILKKEEDMLAANQSIGSGAAGVDLNKLKLALDFQKARLTENKLTQLNNLKQIKKLDGEIDQLRNQVTVMQGKSRNNTSDIAVKVNAKASGNGSFMISYLVKNASWYPTYDLRASDVNKPVDLIYRANISQQSGEEWKNVRLILSSGDPSVGGNKPLLRPYEIGYNVLPHTPGAGINRVRGRVTDAQDGSPLPGVSVRIKGTSIGTTSNVDGQYSIQVPSPQSVLEYNYIGYQLVERPVMSEIMNIQLPVSQSSLSEVVITGSNTTAARLQGKATGIRLSGTSTIPQAAPPEVQFQQGQTTVQFEVQQPYTIQSDGKHLAVEIGNHTLATDYRYYAVPKLNENAYLTASIRGISELNLLSGEANIFFEGAYLGKTLINLQETTDTLSVSLGVDKNLVIKRVPQKEQNEKAFMGSTQRAVRAFSFEALNRKSIPVNLTIEDQIPVSGSSEVSIEPLELTGARHSEATGMLNWDLQLQPKEKKTVSMKYQVKYPKNRPVRLE